MSRCDRPPPGPREPPAKKARRSPASSSCAANAHLSLARTTSMPAALTVGAAAPHGAVAAEAAGPAAGAPAGAPSELKDAPHSVYINPAKSRRGKMVQRVSFGPGQPECVSAAAWSNMEPALKVRCISESSDFCFRGPLARRSSLPAAPLRSKSAAQHPARSNGWMQCTHACRQRVPRPRPRASIVAAPHPPRTPVKPVRGRSPPNDRRSLAGMSTWTVGRTARRRSKSSWREPVRRHCNPATSTTSRCSAAARVHGACARRPKRRQRCC